MPNDKLCKLCQEPLPKLALHFSNKLAIERGFCCWICLSMKIGHIKALALIKEEEKGAISRENQQERLQGKRGGRF